MRTAAGVALFTAFLLVIPLVAMQFTDEVDWTIADFVVAGALLFGAGLSYQLAARRIAGRAYRAAVGVAVASALALAWVNLAVGLIGSEDNPANLMYVAVLAVAALGAVMARLRPPGMARAMLATACAPGVVAVIALVALDHLWTTPLAVVGVNGFFAALFVASAWLFRRASR